MCHQVFFQSMLQINDFLHFLQICGFSPVCMSKCAESKKKNKAASCLSKHLITHTGGKPRVFRIHKVGANLTNMVAAF